MKRLFKYIEPIWLGNDDKLSIRRTLSLVFSINLIFNTHHVIFDCNKITSYGDVALLLGIEAGLIAALLSLTTYSSMKNAQQDPTNTELPA